MSFSFHLLKMFSSTINALSMAMLLLSGPASARVPKRAPQDIEVIPMTVGSAVAAAISDFVPGVVPGFVPGEVQTVTLTSYETVTGSTPISTIVSTSYQNGNGPASGPVSTISSTAYQTVTGSISVSTVLSTFETTMSAISSSPADVAHDDNAPVDVDGDGNVYYGTAAVTSTVAAARTSSTIDSASVSAPTEGSDYASLSIVVSLSLGAATSTSSSESSAPSTTSTMESSAASSTIATTTSASSSAAASSTTTSASASATATSSDFLRGVNLGGWLVLEKWMDWDAFTGDFANAVDQYTFDSIDGAAAALETHWSTYFTESDIQDLAATGINALRIPIGYWAYNNDNTPYLQGADAYLEKAIGWARSANMKVWVDCHGSPGSQNGFDNSGHAGDVEWQQEANLALSISVLETMAQKYGSTEYADVVVGLEMTNEPISYGNNQFSVTQSWAQTAYKAVKAASTNENLVIVMHDAFGGVLSWTDVAQDLNADRTFGIDTHDYQLYTTSDNLLDQAQHITEACGWAANLATANAIMPTFVGEWSAATNICVNPDGSTTAGTSCSVDGCQCQSADFADWNDNMIEQVRRYVEAQLDVFESSTSGYFLWSAKGPGGWGFLNGIGNGAIPNPVTERKYPGQCGSSSSRRSTRGSLGKTPAAF